MKKIFTLSFVALTAFVLRSSAQQVMISEFHYANAGADNERIEITGPAGFDLTGWKILMYNGSNGSSYGSVTIANGTTIPNLGTINGQNFGVVVVTPTSLQDGDPDGLALVRQNGTVSEFLSYGGTFAATSGEANGMTSVNVGVVENGAGTADGSIQRTKDGPPSAGWWTVSATTNSFGALNGALALLPISCKSFTAFLKNDAVAVNWTAACTNSSASFEVQRSINGSDYITINSTKPLGIGEFDYSYTDATPVKGNAMYRLKMIDIDGKATYSSISRVKWGTSGIALNNIFPTTAITIIKLQISSNKNLKAEAQVYDNVGKLVKRQQLSLVEGNLNYDVDVTTLARGGYTIIVQAGEERLTGRFVKQ